MATLKLWLLSVLIVASTVSQQQVTGATSSVDLPVEARDANTSLEEDDVISTSYVLPNQIFNDGKPYYAGKDPISGQLDFSAKKPAGIEPAANEVFDPKEKIVLSGGTPNIYDFLNLPVKYSSSKFVYPLVSSSYANLKYQGSNKNYVTNKKPTLVAAPVTVAPNYHSHNYYTVPTTKLMAVPPTAPGLFGSTSASSPSTSLSTTASTSKPTTPTTTTISTTTTSTKPTSAKVTSTTTKPTAPTTLESSSPMYTNVSRRPIPITSTTFAPRTTTTPTRKKFVPTKKISATTTTAVTVSTPLRFPEDRRRNTTTSTSPTAANTATRPAAPTMTTVFSTSYPTPQSSIFPTHPTSHATSSSSSSGSTTSKLVPTTAYPIHLTENPEAAGGYAFSPLPSGTSIPQLDAADVYQTLGQKHTQQKFEQKLSMSLTDIFNSLADEESALASNNQGNQGFDAQGNLIQPIAPSKPAPFAMHQRPQSTRPTFGTTGLPPNRQQPQFMQDQKVISGSKESFSNEYVSYQVQQPNVMQYRPVPGTINNVVISPGQNSASFVLGSQQQVGTNAFGSVQKEPTAPVQYGTVINEDIGPLKRPSMPTQQHQQQHPQEHQHSMIAQGNSNFHQNGNFPHGPPGPPTQYVQRPLAAPGGYHEEPPAPPSPYQQLPLVGTNSRPHPAKKQQQQQQQQMQQNADAQQQQSQQNQQQLKKPHQQQLLQQQQQKLQQHQLQQQQLQQQTQSVQLVSRPQENIQLQDTKELLVSTNIRFPASEDQSDETMSVPVATGPPSGPQVNGHAQPLSLQQIQHNANTVVFPKTKDEEQQLNDIVYQSEIGRPDDIQIQQHEVLTMNQHKQKLNFPPVPEHQTPSQQLNPPPRFPPASPLIGTSGEPGELQMHKRPATAQQIQQQNHPQYAYNEYTRKPIPGISRPNTDRHLPNILPQFRPNAKISSGHPSANNFNHEPGNVRISSQQPPMRPNAQAPQFAHRRQPLIQQKRYPMNRISDYPAGPPPPEANRRIYRLPPYGAQAQGFFGRRPMPHTLARPTDSYAVERHAFAVGAHQNTYSTLPQYPAMTPDRLAAFEEEDLVINDPPQPVTPSKERKVVDETNLEPVVTLQMLQSQKKSSASSSPNDETGSGEIQVSASPDNNQLDGETGAQNGLYVVYPTRGAGGGSRDSISDVAESQDPLAAVVHIEPPSGSDYQNTPFSVMRDQPEEPILKNKKPQSLQQQTKTPGLKDRFPYPIEKPDPSFAELNAPKRAPGVVIAPRIINGARDTEESPIAIAYTPTEPNPYHRSGAHAGQDQRYSNVNLASAVISEIRTNSQTEEGLGNNNDFDLRGQNLEKNFMAPFYPSVKLGSATSAPLNGWNVLPSTTDASAVYEKNNINRADIVSVAGGVNQEEHERTTKSFELDSFQPELQGGFKPIYPPGYKLDDETNAEPIQQRESNDMLPYALASRMEPMSNNDTSSTTFTTSTSTTATTSTTRRPQSGTTAHSQPPQSTATPVAEKLIATSTTPKAAATTSLAATSTTTNAPGTTPTTSITPTPPRKKSTFETSLAALLFGEDEDFEDQEGRKAPSVAKSGPRNVPRMGPRNLKMS